MNMVTLFVRHAVGDYDAWRKVYDDYFETRKQAGVTGEAVYRSVDDANEVTLVLDFETIETARAFPENPKLEAAYQQAGSVAPPTLWFASKT